MVTLTLKSKVHKFAYFIMLSLLTKLSDLGTSWVFGSKLKGYHPQLDPPNPPRRSSQKLLYRIQTNTICWTLRHIGKAHATRFGQLVPGSSQWASALFKREEREYKAHNQSMKLQRHGDLRDVGHEVGKQKISYNRVWQTSLSLDH